VHQRLWDHADNLGLAWAHHLKIFFSQKHFLLALAFLVVLASALAVVVRARRLPDEYRSFLIILALATGLLPLVHAHTFLAAAGLWAVAAVAVRRRLLVLCAISSLLLALPLLLWYASAVSREGFLHWAPGYQGTTDLRLWGKFWLVNLGLYPFLIVPALWSSQLGRLRWLLVLPAGALFVVGNLFQFQPYAWDNHKLFLLAWVLTLPLACATLARFLARARSPRGLWRAVLVGGAVCFLTLTSVADLSTLVHERAAHPVYTVADRASALALDRALPRSAVVLADTFERHNHPLTLIGRTLVVGYGGWVWTRGYQTGGERAQAWSFFSDGEYGAFCRTVGRLAVTHAVDQFMRVRRTPLCS